MKSDQTKRNYLFYFFSTFFVSSAKNMLMVNKFNNVFNIFIVNNIDCFLLLLCCSYIIHWNRHLSRISVQGGAG